MITVVMTTYAPSKERMEYAHQTLSALIRFLKVTVEPVRLHVADDGSPDKYFIQRLMDRAADAWKTQPSWSDAERHGIGASLNRALEWVEAGDLWLYITDDWALTRHLYLDRAIKFIREHEYDLVRLGPIHPNLKATTRFTTELGWWLDLHQECGGYVFATRPFLASKSFTSRIGPFQENANAYDVERTYAEAVASANAKIASINMRGPWMHLGQYEVGDIVPNGTVQSGRLQEVGEF